MKTTTQTIKELEKKIEKLDKEKDCNHIHCNYKQFLLEAKLQATKQTAEAVKKEVLEIIEDMLKIRNICEGKSTEYYCRGLEQLYVKIQALNKQEEKQ